MVLQHFSFPGYDLLEADSDATADVGGGDAVAVDGVATTAVVGHPALQRPAQKQAPQASQHVDKSRTTDTLHSSRAKKRHSGNNPPPTHCDDATLHGA